MIFIYFKPVNSDELFRYFGVKVNKYNRISPSPR